MPLSIEAQLDALREDVYQVTRDLRTLPTRVVGYSDATPRAFIGEAAYLAEGNYINFTRPDWGVDSDADGQFLVINIQGGLMNVDYVVDASDRGTHTTLPLAVAAAIAAGGNKTIWLCASVTASDMDIGGLGASADLTFASHSQHTVIITANTNEDIFKQDSQGGDTNGGLHFINLGFNIPSANYAIYNNNTGSEIKRIRFNQCEFDLSTLGYIARQDGNDSLGDMAIEVRDCTGVLKGFYDVAGANATYSPDQLRVFGSSLTLTAFWDGGSENAAPDRTVMESGYFALTNGITFPAGATEQTFSNLYITFAAASAIFTTEAASTQIEDLHFQGITIRFSNSSGTFCNLGAGAANNNNGLFFDGIYGYMADGVAAGGTFITVDTDWQDTYIGAIFGKDFSTQYSGPLTDMDATHYHSLLRDDDNDTLIQVEESADGDTIRFDIAGTERMTLDGTKLDLLNSTYLDAADVQLPLLGSPTFTHVEHLNTVYHSSGWISGGNISDVGSGNVTIAAGTGAIRSADSTTAQLLFFDWPELATQAITANSIRYVGVELNDPNDPQVVIRTTNNFDNNTDFMLGTVVNESGTLHVQNAPWKIGDHASAMIQRARGVMPIARDKAVGGLMFSETGTRNVVVSAGALWHGLTSFTIGAIDTDPGGAADTFDTYSADGRKATGVAAWPNEQYDDGDATLQDMGANKWANLWWYLELDGELVMVYGTAQYTSAAKAGEEAAPSTLPDRLQVHGVLAARFIFQKLAGTAEEILSAFDTPFAVLGVTDHGNLAGLGDVATDHPHGISAHISHANWKVLYTDGSGDEQELSLGADGTFLQANGVAAAPTFAALVQGDIAGHGLAQHTEHANWKVLYTDGSGDEQELSLGADGTFLQANGAAAAPTFAGLVVGDIPYDDATSDPLIDADAADDGNEGSPARKDHVHIKHHAKYTNAEAVTALEAEDPFDMAGVLNLAKNLNLTKGVSANIDANDEIAVPAVSWLYLTSAGAADTLSGIGAGAEGQVVILTVVAGKDITLAHDGAVVAGKKLKINGEANVVLNEDHDMALAVYDATATVWNVLVVPGAAGHAEDHKDRHDPEDGADPLDTANAAEISVVVAAGTGTSHSLARADHVHAINHAITDNHLVTIDHAAVADDDYAKFTASGLEGRSFAEVKADLDLEIGTDVLAEQTIGIADNNLLEVDGIPNAAEYARFTAAGLEGRTEAEFKADFNLQIGTDVLAQQTIGIADDNLLEVDHAAAADNDYAKFTANGLEGRSFAEVLADLSGQAGADFDFNTNDIVVDGVYMEEKANANADAAGQGQIWVKTGAPNTLWFTDENGTDVQLGLGAGHAILDGATHTDTAADAVTAGSIIIGNSSPQWDELVIAIPAANVRNVLGIDNAETLPSWKTALDGTNPADIAAAASPGTSLVFAHRDHVHDHPDIAADIHTVYFLADGTRVMSGDIDLDGNNIDNGGVIFLKEQAAADADVPGSGQIWVKTGAPNELWFTDEDGTDVQLGAGGGANHDILDGSVHQDSVADGVTRGSLIYGNSTPKWDELAAGAARTVLTADGTDVAWDADPTIESLVVQQQTINNEVARFESVATNDDPSERIFQGRYGDLNGAKQTILTVTIPANTVKFIEAIAIFRRTGGSAGTAGAGGAIYKRAVYYENGGTVTLVGAIDTVFSQVVHGWLLDLTISGTDILVEVTGADVNVEDVTHVTVRTWEVST